MGAKMFLPSKAHPIGQVSACAKARMTALQTNGACLDASFENTPAAAATMSKRVKATGTALQLSLNLFIEKSRCTIACALMHHAAVHVACSPSCTFGGPAFHLFARSKSSLFASDIFFQPTYELRLEGASVPPLLQAAVRFLALEVGAARSRSLRHSVQPAKHVIRLHNSQTRRRMIGITFLKLKSVFASFKVRNQTLLTKKV